MFILSYFFSSLFTVTVGVAQYDWSSTDRSYIVEVVNPNYVYEPIRVEINSKGKYRARKVNYIQSSHVHQMPYPLEFVNYMPAKYFYTREQWKVTDFLFNSMVNLSVSIKKHLSRCQSPILSLFKSILYFNV